MTPEVYNAAQRLPWAFVNKWLAPRVRMPEVRDAAPSSWTTNAVFRYQNDTGLTGDGKLGPVTLRAMLADGLDILPPVSPSYDGERTAAWALLQAAAWRVLDKAGRRALVRSYWNKKTRWPNYCGAFTCSAVEIGGRAVPHITRRGALKTVRELAEHRGSWLWLPTAPWHPIAALARMRPGDVIAWRRGPVWRGHVAPIVGVDARAGFIEIVNPNTRGGQVVLETLAADEWPNLLSGLYGIARPR